MRNLMLKKPHHSETLEKNEVEEESDFETSNIPEWQFLLGQVNSFLFTMKLKQQRLPHISLTDQDLEESLSFDIMGKVQSQTTSRSISSQQKNPESTNEATSQLRKRLNYKSGLNISLEDDINETDEIDDYIHHKIKYKSAFDTSHRNIHESKNLSQENTQNFSVTEVDAGITQNEFSNARGTF